MRWQSELRFRWGRREITCAVYRDARDTLRISVLPEGRVVVRAPSRATDEELRRRVERRGGWIDRQLRSFDKWTPRTPPRNFVSGETHLYLGKQYRLLVRASLRNAVSIEGPRIIMETRGRSTMKDRQRLLEAWYAARAKEVFPRRIERIADSFVRAGVSPNRLIVRAMRNRWGSFTKAGNLVLNRELVRVAPRLIDYVIVHELAHGAYPDHGARWRSLMTRTMYDWRARKDALERALL
jgi:predicted metal-dependent hydrolase